MICPYCKHKEGDLKDFGLVVHSTRFGAHLCLIVGKQDDKGNTTMYEHSYTERMCSQCNNIFGVKVKWDVSTSKIEGS